MNPGKKPQNLKIKPYQSNHKAECGIPFHILRSAHLAALDYEVEVLHKGEGRNCNYYHVYHDSKDAVSEEQLVELSVCASEQGNEDADGVENKD